MKNKIEIGQCYRTNDHVYMVIQRWGDKAWLVQDTLSKRDGVVTNKTLKTFRRPFTNCG